MPVLTRSSAAVEDVPYTLTFATWWWLREKQTQKHYALCYKLFLLPLQAEMQQDCPYCRKLAIIFSQPAKFLTQNQTTK